MPNINSFNVTYDADSDVLYISTGRNLAARGVEDQYGIVWRYDRDGELIGATVVDFYDQWFNKKPQLAKEISKKFHITTPQALVVVNHALEGKPN